MFLGLFPDMVSFLPGFDGKPFDGVVFLGALCGMAGMQSIADNSFLLCMERIHIAGRR
jgi:hypothetical protein